jgi:tetratricopeptide (TPR) repeat protein
MPITDRLRADIYNQQALLKIIEGKPAAAVNNLNSAFDIHQRQQNRHSTALSLQLLAQTAYLQKHYRSTVKYAEQARKIYALTQNHSAYAECLYLAASAQCRQNSLVQAENNLRDILKWTRHISCNFHVANVYNLLGIIYLQKYVVFMFMNMLLVWDLKYIVEKGKKVKQFIVLEQSLSVDFVN